MGCTALLAVHLNAAVTEAELGARISTGTADATLLLQILDHEAQGIVHSGIGENLILVHLRGLDVGELLCLQAHHEVSDLFFGTGELCSELILVTDKHDVEPGVRASESELFSLEEDLLADGVAVILLAEKAGHRELDLVVLHYTYIESGGLVAGALEPESTTMTKASSPWMLVTYASEPLR